MKTRTERRSSTRSAVHVRTLWSTASAMKLSASRLAAMIETRIVATGAMKRQLTKLNAVTAAHSKPCHQRNLNASSNSARVNSQNTTALPVDKAISGACQVENG